MMNQIQFNTSLIDNKVAEALYFSEQNNPHPSPIPSIQSWGVRYYYS